MELIKQPNRWSCMPTSLAMVLGTDVDSIIKAIGHDGSMIVDPTLPEPQCRQGFHIDELVYVALRYHAICLVQFSAVPGFSDGKPYLGLSYAGERMRNPGLLWVDGRRHGHMVAWDGQKVYDPTGPAIRDVSDFRIGAFWEAF